MTDHSCPRCGYETTQSRGARWVDLHPAATVLAAVFIGLPTVFFLAGVVLAYPWFSFPIIVVAAAAWVDRRQRVRSAIAARADWEHREAMARAMPGIRREPTSPPRPPRRAWHVMTHYPTTKMRSPTKDRW